MPEPNLLLLWRRIFAYWLESWSSLPFACGLKRFLKGAFRHPERDFMIFDFSDNFRLLSWLTVDLEANLYFCVSLWNSLELFLHYSGWSQASSGYCALSVSSEHLQAEDSMSCASCTGYHPWRVDNPGWSEIGACGLASDCSSWTIPVHCQSAERWSRGIHCQLGRMGNHLDLFNANLKQTGDLIFWNGLWSIELQVELGSELFMAGSLAWSKCLWQWSWKMNWQDYEHDFA